MINRTIYEVKSQEVHEGQKNPLMIVRAIKKPQRLRNYSPLIWDNGNLPEVKENKQEIVIKPSGRCVIL